MKISSVWVIGKKGLEDSVENFKHVAKRYFNLKDKRPDIVATIGGEGTVFRAVKEYPNSVVLPFRKLSFGALSQLDESDALMALEKIKKGEYVVENIMRLEIKYKGLKAWGINDVCVLRDDENANRFRVFSDNEDVYGNELMGDGVIGATPYGSTGYNWTAGGPILNRNESRFVITPVCSAYFNQRLVIENRNVMKKAEESKIFPDNKEVVIKFSRDIRNKIVPDGRQEERVYVDIKAGDKVIIRKSKENSKLLRILQ